MSSDAGWTAAGVEFTLDGQSFTAYAAREVILAAGVVQTPQLLELSGVYHLSRKICQSNKYDNLF